MARTRDLDQLEARLEARFEASIERAMRQQLGRFLLAVGGLVTIVAAVQTVVTQLVAG